MKIRDLIPWKREKLPVRVRHGNGDSFYPMRTAIDRLFEEFLTGFDLMPFESSLLGTFNPRVDIKENKKAFVIKAELPGMEPEDVEITVLPDAIMLKGEKRVEEEEEGTNYYRMERSYGAFSRTIPIPGDLVDTDKADAAFKRGVLTITLPKRKEAVERTRRIPVKVKK